MNSIKTFKCKKHPSRDIVSLSLDQQTFSFYCLECLNSTNPFSEGIKLQYLEDLIETLTIEGNKACNSLIVSSKPDLVAKISSEVADALARFQKHIDSEKGIVKDAFSKIKKVLKSLLKEKEKSMLEELDNQKNIFEASCERNQTLLRKFFDPDARDQSKNDKTALSDKIRQCLSLDDLERCLKAVKAENELISNVTSIDEVLRCFQLSFEYSRPFSYFKDYSKLEETSNKLRTALSVILAQIPNEVLNEVPKNPELVMIGCSFVQNLEQNKILRSWLDESNPKVSLKSIYKASRDGFDAASFHRLCNDVGPTLTIIKSKEGKIFGGYTDAKWNSNTTSVASQKSWLFSLDRKEKYPINQTNYAIHCRVNYGPTFGGGHDIYICHNSNTTAGSYSNFGNSYDCGTVPQNEKQTALTQIGLILKILKS